MGVTGRNRPSSNTEVGGYYLHRIFTETDEIGRDKGLREGDRERQRDGERETGTDRGRDKEEIRTYALD